MTQEQETLLSKSAETLRAAQWLISGGYYAHAVSRIYYAMFYATQAILLERGLHFSKHASTVAAFGQHFIKTGLLDAHLHQSLKRAFDKRLVGDYDVNATVSAHDASELLNQANEFVTAITRFIGLAPQTTPPPVSNQSDPTIGPDA